MLIHQDRGVLGMIFIGSERLTGGLTSAEIIAGLSDTEVTQVLELLGEHLESLSEEELAPFDAYPYEEALDSSGDFDRAQELGMEVAPFRASWNKVLFGLRAQLFTALPYLLHQCR